MGDEVDDEPTGRAAKAGDGPAVDVDDDLWAFSPEDDDHEPTRSALPLVLMVVGVLAVVAVLVAVLAGGKDDKDETAAGGNGTEQPAGGASTTPATATCPRWPATVDAMGVPEVAAAPGIHLWYDFTGWHVRRVDGDGVPSAVVTVNSTTADQPPTPGAATGGATVGAGEGNTVVLTLPDADGTSEAGFDIPVYAQGVVIDFKDDAGQPLATDALTGGANAGPIVANPLTATLGQVPC